MPKMAGKGKKAAKNLAVPRKSSNFAPAFRGLCPEGHKFNIINTNKK
jgi:hypothetical protein